MADQLDIDLTLSTSVLPDVILGSQEVLGGSILPPNVLADNMTVGTDPIGEPATLINTKGTT